MISVLKKLGVGLTIEDKVEKEHRKFDGRLRRCRVERGIVKSVHISEGLHPYPHKLDVRLEDPVLTDGKQVKGYAFCPEDRPIEEGKEYYFYVMGIQDPMMSVGPLPDYSEAIFSYGKAGTPPFDGAVELKRSGRSGR